MTATRQKLEILVDRPLATRIAAVAQSVGVTGYTLLPTLSGHGHGGSWSDDQITGATAKVMFWTVTTEDKARAMLDALAPLLDTHGLLVTSHPVDVIRDAKF